MYGYIPNLLILGAVAMSSVAPLEGNALGTGRASDSVVSDRDDWRDRGGRRWDRKWNRDRRVINNYYYSPYGYGSYYGNYSPYGYGSAPLYYIPNAYYYYSTPYYSTPYNYYYNDPGFGLYFNW